MSYLVTGGAGYIGSYIVRSLIDAGKEVCCLDLAGVTPIVQEVIGKENLHKVKFVKGDIGNAVQLFSVLWQHGIDLIIHTASLVGHLCDLQPSHALWVNCIGTNNIMEAARIFGVRRVIWTSSGKVFGQLGAFYDKPVADDNALYMHSSMYGATKAINEFMTKLYFEKFGVDTIALRLGRTFGGGHNDFSNFLRKAALNIPVTLGKADVDPILGNGYGHIEDISHLAMKACDVPTTETRVFNGNFPFQLAMRHPDPYCSYRQ